MTSTRPSPPPFGVYVPSVVFFHDDESLDLESLTQHVKRVLESGVTGIVVQGSNGEATHLSHQERSLVIRHIRSVATQLKKPTVVIAGCSANSVRETLEYTVEAKDAGADYALVLPPNYWAGAMSKPVLKSFYVEVASKSALPVVIYNFPGVTANIDIDSDLIIDLAKTCPQIVGVKLTCGNVGKLQRVSATLPPARFAPFAGKADFLLPGLVVGSNGVISALANIVPKLHVHVLRLYEKGELKSAQEIQAKLSTADWALLKMGISGVKAANTLWFGYGTSNVRKPLPRTDPASIPAEIKFALQPVVDLEQQIPSHL